MELSSDEVVEIFGIRSECKCKAIDKRVHRAACSLQTALALQYYECKIEIKLVVIVKS